ncbi:MAG: acylneuraminate cytidylyltransferase family protein [Candidatus Niyogibacteria bacterium]|nr:acylneuraminate cytidylyltransferase family protein [Candidatus Niyogibacteria bacterium]
MGGQKVKNNVLCVIQARGGSKGLPGKNIRILAGKPLIAWTIEAALTACRIDRVIVSTENQEIAAVARAYGAEVPFMRPEKLALDNVKSIGLLNHALLWFMEHENYYPNTVVQLKPTNPLRTAQHIDLCVEKFFANPGIDSLITVTRSSAHPLKMWKFTENSIIIPFLSGEIFSLKEAVKLPRQMLPQVFVQNSCVNVICSKTILEKHSSIGSRVIGIIMEREDAINIDDILDFKIAEMMMNERITGGGQL